MSDPSETKPLIFTPASGNGQSLSYDATKEFGKRKILDLPLKPIPDPLSYQTLVDESSEKITFTWSDVNVYALMKRDDYWRSIFARRKRPVEQKHVVRDAFGVALPGELLVIMGSSGAGKTTLLNALTLRSGKNFITSGTIAINSRKVDSNTIISKSAYVQQDDLFIGMLTVKEHLIFQAMVKMDRHMLYSQRLERVEQVMVELALSKSQNTIIGIPGRVKGLSGGERKRLAFASEILTNPPLMFCDEPTSGLDSFMAHQIVSILKNLTAQGKTIIVTLHQPSSEVFTLFDKILLMVEGRIAFLGTPKQANVFFETLGASCPWNYNPADYFIQILSVSPGREFACRNAVESVCDAFRYSDLGTKIALEAAIIQDESDNSSAIDFGFSRNSPYKASWCMQFRAVLWRSWISVMKEPILIRVRLLQTIMVSLLIGIIYYQQQINQDGVMNINGALFIFLTNMTFQNVFAVVSVFCAELPIFLREHHNGMYRTDVYFLCKTLTETPIFIAIPFILTSIAYPMIGLYSTAEKFLFTVLITTLIANVATSFGYLVSCISTSVSMALSIGPPIIIPFLLFGGFFLNTASIPYYFTWLSYLSWFRFGNEALLINQWSDIDEIACTRSNTTCPKNGNMVLEALNFEKSDFTLDISSLAALIVAFRVLAFFALLSKTYTHKKS